MRFFVALVSLAFLSSCSYNEYFVVINNSNQAISISFTYEIDSTAIEIFDNRPDVYSLNEENINWSDKKEVKLKESWNAYELTLPAKSGLVFGNLSNEHFESVDQEFINMRKFNFIEMKIGFAGTETIVLKETFSDFFKKEGGYIQYLIN